MKASLSLALRLRRIALKEAQSDLGAAVRIEAAAVERLTASSRAISNEIAAATSPRIGDDFVGALAVWLPAARATQSAAQVALEEAVAATVHARAVVAAARAAEAQIETLIGARAAEIVLRNERRDNEM